MISHATPAYLDAKYTVLMSSIALYTKPVIHAFVSVLVIINHWYIWPMGKSNHFRFYDPVSRCNVYGLTQFGGIELH